MPYGNPIRVLIVEDHPGLRLVLRALLETDERLIVIDDVGTGTSALQHPLLDDVDVALVDIGLPDMAGTDATRKLRQLNPVLRVLVMSGSGFQSASTDALAAGADAYLEKGALHDDLLEAIVAAGERGRADRGSEKVAQDRVEARKMRVEPRGGPKRP
jgi:DNA-binding NarL/FixJ family response regulator